MAFCANCNRAGAVMADGQWCVRCLASIPTVIDADEFEAAKRDPKVRKFQEEARKYGERMKREGRMHD